MDEVDNLVKILLEDYKAREIFCFGYIQKNIFVFNYGSGPKLSPFQEKLLKAYFESPYFVIYKLFEAMENKKLSELIAPFKKYYHSGELNFEVEDKQSIIEKVEKNYSYGKITKIDGVRIDFDDWWFLLRGSNTEPILRLIIEAKSKELLDGKIKEIIPFFS